MIYSWWQAATLFYSQWMWIAVCALIMSACLCAVRFGALRAAEIKTQGILWSHYGAEHLKERALRAITHQRGELGWVFLVCSLSICGLMALFALTVRFFANESQIAFVLALAATGWLTVVGLHWSAKQFLGALNIGDWALYVVLGSAGHLESVQLTERFPTL